MSEPRRPSPPAAPSPRENQQDEEAPSRTLLVEMVLSEHERRVVESTPSQEPIQGVVLGRLVGFGSAGEPLVDHPASGGAPLPARSAVPLEETLLGREVALVFEAGDPRRPFVLGLLHVFAASLAEQPPSEPSDAEASPAAAGAAPSDAVEEERAGVSVEADGERVVVQAQRELVLRCGKASITLTRAGKVLIRGAYVCSRSTGAHRIQGGSVEIN